MPSAPALRTFRSHAAPWDRRLVYDELLAIARAVHRVLTSGTKACAGRGQERPSG